MPTRRRTLHTVLPTPLLLGLMGLLAACGSRGAIHDTPDAALPASDSAPPPPVVAGTACSHSPCAAGEPCVQTLAGSGAEGQNDGSALEARFRTPGGVAVDASGRIFVTEGGATLRVVYQDQVSTLGGDAYPFVQLEGIAVDLADPAYPQGTIYIADPGAEAIWRVRGSNVTQLELTSGEPLLEPVDVAVHHGVVYVADRGNASCLFGCGQLLQRPPRVLRIQNGQVSELPQSRFLSQADIEGGTWYLRPAPSVVAVTADGAVLFDTDHDAIRVVRGNDVIDIPTPNALFLSDLALRPGGEIYGTSDLGNRVGRLSWDGDLVTIPPLGADPAQALGDAACVDGAASRARFFLPSGLAFGADGRQIVVADTGNRRLRRITLP